MLLHCLLAALPLIVVLAQTYYMNFIFNNNRYVRLDGMEGAEVDAHLVGAKILRNNRTGSSHGDIFEDNEDTVLPKLEGGTVEAESRDKERRSHAHSDSYEVHHSDEREPDGDPTLIEDIEEGLNSDESAWILTTRRPKPPEMEKPSPADNSEWEIITKSTSRTKRPKTAKTKTTKRVTKKSTTQSIPENVSNEPDEEITTKATPSTDNTGGSNIAKTTPPITITLPSDLTKPTRRTTTTVNSQNTNEGTKPNNTTKLEQESPTQPYPVVSPTTEPTSYEPPMEITTEPMPNEGTNTDNNGGSNIVETTPPITITLPSDLTKPTKRTTTTRNGQITSAGTIRTPPITITLPSDLTTTDKNQNTTPADTDDDDLMKTSEGPIQWKSITPHPSNFFQYPHAKCREEMDLHELFGISLLRDRGLPVKVLCDFDNGWGGPWLLMNRMELPARIHMRHWFFGYITEDYKDMNTNFLALAHIMNHMRLAMLIIGQNNNDQLVYNLYDDVVISGFNDLFMLRKAHLVEANTTDLLFISIGSVMESYTGRNRSCPLQLLGAWWGYNLWDANYETFCVFPVDRDIKRPGYMAIFIKPSPFPVNNTAYYDYAMTTRRPWQVVTPPNGTVQHLDSKEAASQRIKDFELNKLRVQQEIKRRAEIYKTIEEQRKAQAMKEKT